MIHVNNTKNENKDNGTYLKRKSINFELWKISVQYLI
jgi:hypothetical protein